MIGCREPLPHHHKTCIRHNWTYRCDRYIRSQAIQYDINYYESLAISHLRWHDAEDVIYYDAPTFSATWNAYENEHWYDTMQEEDVKLDGLKMSDKTYCSYIATLDTLNTIGVRTHQDSVSYQTEAYLSKPGTFEVPVVIDTGCSMSVSPCAEDFQGEVEPLDQLMHGLDGAAKVHGVGWVEWPIIDVFNNVNVMRTRCYHTPKAEMWLLSMQTIFQENQAVTLTQHYEKVVLNSPNGPTLTFPNQQGNNPPLM